MVFTAVIFVFAPLFPYVKLLSEEKKVKLAIERYKKTIFGGLRAD